MYTKIINKRCLFFSCVFILLSFSSSSCGNLTKSSSEIIYSNPRVYNVQYSFEITPDTEKPDIEKDLKVWLPVPREWASQEYVKLIKVTPTPHDYYQDPEHENQILYWDFSKEPTLGSYIVDIEFRLESYEIYSKVEPEQIPLYDKTADDYNFYTRNSHTISITPKVKELALIAVGGEKNPYLQAKRIFEFVRKKMRYAVVEDQRGRGIKCLLDYPIIDEATGEEYYQGACGQYSALFIALCRAEGVPARSINGWTGWAPWVKAKDLKLVDFRRSVSNEKLPPDTAAGGCHYYVSLTPHSWAEFYLPNLGWIPVDATHGKFGHLSNKRFIISKGHDIKIGPHTPQQQDHKYGSRNVLLHQGRVDMPTPGVWNHERTGTAKVKVSHYSDPFPADAYAQYTDFRQFSKSRRKMDMLLLYNNVKRREDVTFRNREAYFCHLFKQVVGDEIFNTIFANYLTLRLSSKEPISVFQFQEISENIYGESLEWFFDQWLDDTAIPQFKLNAVDVKKSIRRWVVSGEIIQKGESIFRTPVEVGIDSEKGMNIQKIWLDSKATTFEFRTWQKPNKLILDPNYNIPCIRQMPPRLRMLWDYYPNMILIYGTPQEAEANRVTAERFNNEVLGLDSTIIMADTNVTVEDLQKDIVLLFGRPRTNTAIGRMEYAFPIQFKDVHFSWDGIIYDNPAQGVMQIIENPISPTGWIIQYAGLSSEATTQITDVTAYPAELSGEVYIQHKGPISVYDANASYIIFKSMNVLVSGDWGIEGELIWEFETQKGLNR